MTTVINETANRELSITRLLNAPQELVWEVWTKPEHIANWWGPVGFTTTTHEMNVKPGGVWRFMMHGPDGRDYPNKIVFIEVVRPERLVYNHTGEDETEDVRFHVTVNFERQGNKTKLTMRSLFESKEELIRVMKEYGAEEGMKQTVDRLGEYLENKQPAQLIDDVIVIERSYNAPIEKVWKAITDKDEMKKWYFDLSAFKPEPGFEFQFYGVGKQGQKFLHLCKVIEVINQKKLTYSWGYDGYGGNSFVTFELFPEGSKTRLKLSHKGLETFPATAHNDFAKENFMEGWTHIIGTGLKEYVEKANN
ncbi:MAG TPA: SRPBCC family protein [Chitinophagaceae bacterium]|nr:SRPBCC family protein [Chitinophagaceae bacterium]